MRSHGRLLHKRSTLEILMRGKMVGAAEAAQHVYSHPHRFERYSYTTPTYCDLCSNVLWGPVKVDTVVVIMCYTMYKLTRPPYIVDLTRRLPGTHYNEMNPS